MEELSQIHTMLQLMAQPAFWVEDGVISHVNQAASRRLIEAGQPFAPMILSGGEEYEAFSAGTLYMTLSVAGRPEGARVTRMENGNMVTLAQSAGTEQLRAMAVAANILKDRLSAVMSVSERILPGVAAQGSESAAQAAQMNHRLYQMMRTLNNMTDAVEYVQAQPGRMESIEICAFLEELLEKSATLGQQDGILLAYELPNERIFTLADTEMLERSVFNLLSNAIKLATPKTTVRAKLAHKNKRLYISISSTHPSTGSQKNMFDHYLREPGLESIHDGVGLGMVLVRSTATLHGGAVLVDQTEDGSRVTMTLQVKSNAPNQVRSPILRFDYAGEHDHCLLELADVLSAHHYSVENIK